MRSLIDPVLNTDNDRIWVVGRHASGLLGKAFNELTLPEYVPLVMLTIWLKHRRPLSGSAMLD